MVVVAMRRLFPMRLGDKYKDAAPLADAETDSWMSLCNALQNGLVHRAWGFTEPWSALKGNCFLVFNPGAFGEIGSK